jgi:hypothetical protein
MKIFTLLSNHLMRYPAIQAQDVYKLIHQAACGPAHAVTNSKDAHDWLEKELKNLSDPYPEPIIDPISLDGALVRVHLAPYMAGGGDPEVLLNAFIRTSHEFFPDHDRLEGYLMAVQLEIAGLQELAKTLKIQGYPALHHSDQYRAAYKPAYRVVLKKFL